MNGKMYLLTNWVTISFILLIILFVYRRMNVDRRVSNFYGRIFILSYLYQYCHLSKLVKSGHHKFPTSVKTGERGLDFKITRDI